MKERRTSFRCCGRTIKTPFCPICGMNRLEPDPLDEARKFADWLELQFRKVRTQAETKRRRASAIEKELLAIPDLYQRLESAEDEFGQFLSGYGYESLDASRLDYEIRRFVVQRKHHADEMEEKAEKWIERAEIVHRLIEALEKKAVQ